MCCSTTQACHRGQILSSKWKLEEITFMRTHSTTCRCIMVSVTGRAHLYQCWWWWCYPTPSEGWGRGGTPRRPNSRAIPQGLDQRSKMEEVMKQWFQTIGGRPDGRAPRSSCLAIHLLDCSASEPFLCAILADFYFFSSLSRTWAGRRGQGPSSFRLNLNLLFNYCIFLILVVCKTPG